MVEKPGMVMMVISNPWQLGVFEICPEKGTEISVGNEVKQKHFSGHKFGMVLQFVLDVKRKANTH